MISSQCVLSVLPAGGALAISDALEHYELRDRGDSITTLPDTCNKTDSRMKNRRVSLDLNSIS